MKACLRSEGQLQTERERAAKDQRLLIMHIPPVFALTHQ
ncbi:Putative uncharacterized protein [Moritella viscosa]|nr:Putative uncharacterized protein [Moritella viscosa]